MKEIELRVVPCDFRVLGNRYFATIHLLIEHDTLSTYAFWHYSDCCENSQLMTELGIAHSYFSVQVPLHDFSFVNKFKELLIYRTDVSQSYTH